MNKLFECDFTINWESVEKTDTLWMNKVEGHRFTVLDRLTGFGDGDIRDIETGYKDLDGKVWIASGDFDIRTMLPLEIDEAIKLIKDNANTCVGS